MKRLFLLFLIAIIMVSFSGCKNDNSISISKAEIKSTKIYNEISNAAYKECLYQAFGDKEAAEEQLQKVWLPTEKKEVTAYLKELKKICNTCEEKGILMSRKSMAPSLENAVEQLKTDESQGNYYKALLNVLKEKNISFEEYLSLMEDYYYYTANKGALKYYYFQNNGYDKKSKKSLDEQFEEYVKKLK